MAHLSFGGWTSPLHSAAALALLACGLSRCHSSSLPVTRRGYGGEEGARVPSDGLYRLPWTQSFCGSILATMMRVYCEHGALLPDLVTLQRQGVIELLHFPYDPDSRSQHLKTLAVPSEARWSDLNIGWNEDGYTWNEHNGSQHLGEIRQILGPENRRDALHIDSAFKSGCRAFVTQDTHILKHRQCLEELLTIRFFDSNKDKEALLQFIHAENGAGS